MKVKKIKKAVDIFNIDTLEIGGGTYLRYYNYYKSEAYSYTAMAIFRHRTWKVMHRWNLGYKALTRLLTKRV